LTVPCAFDEPGYCTYNTTEPRIAEITVICGGS